MKINRYKKILFAILLIGLLLIMYIWYYQFIGFENLDRFGEKVYFMSRQEWSEQTLLKEDIKSYNDQVEDVKLNNFFQVRKYAQKVADKFYEGCSNQQPFVIKFIKNQDAWIIQGSTENLVKHEIYGGVMYLVLDKNTADILYIAHTA